MPCEGCAVQFSVFKRKRVCGECERYYCSGCLRRGGGAMCAPCRLLCARPLLRLSISHLKVRDLQCFLQRQNVSTRGCVEKDELVSLCVSHVNSAAYHRRGSGTAGGATGARAPAGAFTLKGFTNNLNEFINSAFDLRPPGPQPAHPPHAPHPARPPPPPQTRSGCCNATHVHIVIPLSQPCSHSDLRNERFSVTPGGERDVRMSAEAAGPAAAGGAGGGVSRASSQDSARVESADCFEIEDVDDAGWEFVTRPADPLPNDSEVLLSATESAARPEPEPEPATAPGAPAASATPYVPGPRPMTRLVRELLDRALNPGEASVARAASELELRGAGSASNADTGSLKDELLDGPDHSASNNCTPKHVTLETLRSASELELLSVRQLKELLVRNRVEFRGCIERADLLTRAQMLYKDHVTQREELDRLPIEECCKICMAAPLECVLLECGHIAACTACAKQLAECPICRQYVVRAVRFFRS